MDRKGDLRVPEAEAIDRMREEPLRETPPTGRRFGDLTRKGAIILRFYAGRSCLG